MKEKDTIGNVKAKRGIFSRIQDFFTLGYGTKEDLREFDKKLRDSYYEKLRELRHVWEDVYEAVLNASLTSSTRNFKRIIQILDRVTEKVRHADYGYAGLMDRKGHIREDELARVFDYDKSLSGDLEKLEEAVNNANGQAEEEEWEKLQEEAKNLKRILLSFEIRWSERESQFRPLNI